MNKDFEVKDMKVAKAEAKKEVKTDAPKKVEVAAPATSVKKGSMIKPVYGKLVDPITCVSYPEKTWSEVEKPSDWLDGVLAAGKLEVR